MTENTPLEVAATANHDYYYDYNYCPPVPPGPPDPAYDYYNYNCDCNYGYGYGYNNDNCGGSSNGGLIAFILVATFIGVAIAICIICRHKKRQQAGLIATSEEAPNDGSIEEGLVESGNNIQESGDKKADNFLAKQPKQKGPPGGGFGF